MKLLKSNRILVQYLLIFAGTAVMAFSIKSIYDPVNMITGGFSGVAIIVKETTEGVVPGGIPLWLTTIALNLPLFLIAWRLLGFAVIKRSLTATILLSAWLYILPDWILFSDDFFLTALFGGVTCGGGMGLIFLAEATTGGTDLAASIIRKWFPHFSIAQIMQVIDGMIVLLGAGIFGLQKALYAIAAIYITTRVTDGLIEGLKFSKAAYIITAESELVKQHIFERLDRGVTLISARGGYSGEEKNMLFCVVSKKEIVPLKELVRQLDDKAFVIVTDAHEVLGEGFQEGK